MDIIFKYEIETTYCFGIISLKTFLNKRINQFVEKQKHIDGNSSYQKEEI